MPPDQQAMDRCKYCGLLVPADQLEQHVAEEKTWSRRRPKNWKTKKQSQSRPVRVVHQESATEQRVDWSAVGSQFLQSQITAIP